MAWASSRPSDRVGGAGIYPGMPGLGSVRSSDPPGMASSRPLDLVATEGPESLPGGGGGLGGLLGGRSPATLRAQYAALSPAEQQRYVGMYQGASPEMQQSVLDAMGYGRGATFDPGGRSAATLQAQYAALSPAEQQMRRDQYMAATPEMQQSVLTAMGLGPGGAPLPRPGTIPGVQLGNPGAAKRLAAMKGTSGWGGAAPAPGGFGGGMPSSPLGGPVGNLMGQKPGGVPGGGGGPAGTAVASGIGLGGGPGAAGGLTGGPLGDGPVGNLMGQKPGGGMPGGGGPVETAVAGGLGGPGGGTGAAGGPLGGGGPVGTGLATGGGLGGLLRRPPSQRLQNMRAQQGGQGSQQWKAFKQAQQPGYMDALRAGG